MNSTNSETVSSFTLNTKQKLVLAVGVPIVGLCLLKLANLKGEMRGREEAYTDFSRILIDNIALLKE